MIDRMEIGSAPSDEDCAQVGETDYHAKSLKECRAYINLLKRTFGEEPTGARLRIKTFPHDFGYYHEVVCVFDDDYPTAVAYAFQCEGHAPTRWDDQALIELGRKMVGWTA